MNGYWKGSLGLNWGLGFSPLGTAPNTRDSPLLFTQEADLTLSLWLWRRWFLEVSFLDDYNLNTYRAGYQGFPGETVQYVGAGNTGLNFPVFPYLDLGGESPSSFGVYGRFGPENLVFHTLFRYDAAGREERTFVGNRERGYVTLPPGQPLRGRSFVLPDENIPSVPALYLEDKGGEFSGGGRRWRRAAPSEYAVSARSGLVELVRRPAGMAAVSYAGVGPGGTPNLGSYYTGSAGAPGPGTGFLGEVQDHFDPARTGIKLWEYPQSGDAASSGEPGIVAIHGVYALVIYEPGTFSPFERQSRYQAPQASVEEAVIIRLSTGERIAPYEVLPVSSLTAGLDNTLYSLTGDETSRGTFEVSAGERNRRSPGSLWPLGEYPEIYLPGSPAFAGDMCLRFTSYGPPGAYSIGTDVIPGSVQVYRGGLPDSQASYNPGSGVVTLGSPAGFNEVIRVSYLKRSEDQKVGSLAAGVGVVYRPEESPFSAEAALGMRWNLSREAFTEEGAASPGTVGFGAKGSWDYGGLKASLSLGLGFEQPDTTGLHRVAGMEGRSEIVLGLSTTAGVISQTPADPAGPSPPFSGLDRNRRVPLVYRNYRWSDFLGVSTLKPIDWSAPVISNLEGPYPAQASELNADVFAAEFENLSAGDWTGFQVPLGADSGVSLESAGEIILPLRFYGGPPPGDLKVFVQFGGLSGEDFPGPENPSLIVTGEIFPGNSFPDPKVPAWSLGRVTLSDADRRKLKNPRYMRILLVPGPSFSGVYSGRLLAAKPYIQGAVWNALTVEGGAIKAAPDPGGGTGAGVRAVEVRAPDLGGDRIARLHRTGTNFVLRIDWTGMESAGAGGRVSALPLSTYRILSFYLKGPLPADSEFHFLVSRGPDSWGREGETALELTMEIPPGHPLTENRWRSVEIQYGRERRRVLIDGAEYGGAIQYRPAVSRRTGAESGSLSGGLDGGQSAYLAAFFVPKPGGGGASGGVFSIDEVCLEDPSPAYRVNGGAALDWNHPEALIKAGEKTVVSGAAFTTALESALRGDPFNSRAETFTGAQSRSQGKITILDTKIAGVLNFTVSNDFSHWSAGHDLSRSFGPFSVSETFNADPAEGGETMDHRFSLGLDTPFYGKISSSLGYQYNKLSRNWDTAWGIRPEQNGRPGFSLEGGVKYTEKTGQVLEWMPNYAHTWVQSWPYMIPDSGAGVEGRIIQNRDLRARAGFVLDFLPAGADLSVEGTSAVSIPLELTTSSSRVRLLFPFHFGPLRGALRSERGLSQSLVYAAEDTAGDVSQYGQSLSAAAPLWRRIPVFALFDPDLAEAMDKTLSNYGRNADNARFNEVLALSLFFPERYDWLSLVLPVSFLTQLDRTMDQRMDTRLDVFTISSVLGFSSINLFGAMGSLPVFRFYQSDELSHSLAGMISIPRSEDPRWRIQAEQTVNFSGFKGAELGLNNALTVSSTGWADSFTLLWTIPAERTLLAVFYHWGIKKIAGSGYFPAIDELAAGGHDRFLRESLELVLDYSGEYGTYALLLGHESVVRALGRLTLTGFAKLNILRNMELETTALNISFGTTLTLTF
jgi:hypothetical protein